MFAIAIFWKKGNLTIKSLIRFCFAWNNYFMINDSRKITKKERKHEWSHSQKLWIIMNNWKLISWMADYTLFLSWEIKLTGDFHSLTDGTQIRIYRSGFSWTRRRTQQNALQILIARRSSDIFLFAHCEKKKGITLFPQLCYFFHPNS